MNLVPADHSLVTKVRQLEDGEKNSSPGTDTTRGLSCRSGGGATAASLPFNQSALMTAHSLIRQLK